MLPVYMGPDVRHAAQPAEKTEIVYRLDAGQMRVPMSTARIEGQSVSYDQVDGGLIADQSVGTLRITYPHPDAPVGCARAEVQIDSAAMPNVMQLDRRPGEALPWFQRLSHSAPSPADAQHETWVLDIPRAELDDLLGTLSSPGHVTIAGRGKTTGVTLTTEFNLRHSQGSCQKVPELDAVMRNVRDSGRLVAYSRPMSARAQLLEKHVSSVAMVEKSQAAGSTGISVSNRLPAVLPTAHITGLAAVDSDLSDRTVLLPSRDDVQSKR